MGERRERRGEGRARGSDVWLQRIPQPVVMATFIRKSLPRSLEQTGGGEMEEEMDKKRKKAKGVKQKASGCGVFRRNGAQKCLRGRDGANKSPGIRTCAA